MAGATPVYQRIIDDIEAKIRTGELRPSQRLPSLAELALAYGCSAQPVKTALRLLQYGGVLEGHQGRGVYVTDRRPNG
jgi:DNA-binding GntR family transcriptional regulator